MMYAKVWSLGSGIVLQVRVGEFLGWANEPFCCTGNNLKCIWAITDSMELSVKEAYAMNMVKEE
jgi:hypothetical protein